MSETREVVLRRRKICAFCNQNTEAEQICIDLFDVLNDVIQSTGGKLMCQDYRKLNESMTKAKELKSRHA